MNIIIYHIIVRIVGIILIYFGVKLILKFKNAEYKKVAHEDIWIKVIDYGLIIEGVSLIIVGILFQFNEVVYEISKITLNGVIIFLKEIFSNFITSIKGLIE